MAAAAAATKTGKIEFIVDQDRPAVTMKRRFDAPRRLVFEAMTRPEHVKRWYGLHGTTVPVCEIDLRPGGAYRIVNRDPQGNEYGFKGVYREIDPPARVVYTWIFEPMPDKVSVVTDVYDEVDGKTTLTSTTLFNSFEERDGFLATGATEGAIQTFDRLEELLKTLV
jgi:uncharacterized protein YndB with AHSA1/START domain